MNRLPAEFLQAAADLSGHDPGELDEQQALYILQEYGREPQGDLYRQLTSAAAGVLFSDPGKMQEWREATAEWDGDLPDCLAFALQRELSPLIRQQARKLYDDLPQDDPKREELKKILIVPALSPEGKKALEKTLSLSRELADLLEPTMEGVRKVNEALQMPIAAAEAVQNIAAAADGLLEAISAAAAPARFMSQMFAEWEKLRELTAEYAERNPAALLIDEITGDLAPYIYEELQKPEYGGKTLQQILDETETDENGQISETSELMQLVQAARAAAGEATPVKEEPAEAAAGEEKQPPKAPEHTDLTEMNFTTDRLPYIFFGGTLPAPAKEDVPGQLSFTPIKEQYSGEGHTENFIYWHYFIDEATFERLGLSKVYDYEDYFILCVLFTERVLGNSVISPTALYKDVYGKEPGHNDIELFRKRLQKLDATRIYINNHDLMATWKGADPNATYTEGLYHLINIDFTVEKYLFNGKVAKEIIRIGEVPALLQIGADLNRMTKIPKSAFYVTDYKTGNRVRSTPRYWHALIYLTRRVAQMKNGSGETKILYDTLYSELHAKKPREKQLTRDVVYKILEHWRRIGWIKAYKEETTKSTGKTGVKIILPGPALTAKKRKQIAQKSKAKAEKTE